MPRKVGTGSHSVLKHKTKRDNISKTMVIAVIGTFDEIRIHGFIAMAQRQTPSKLQAQKFNFK